MTSIYDQHQAAFANVQAAVIMRGADRVATIAFKFPRDGAGRLTCYLHWIGLEMVRGFASGYGYDKRSAAAGAAACKLPTDADNGGARDLPGGLDELIAYRKFRAALMLDNGYDWHRNLADAGFTVWNAV